MWSSVFKKQSYAPVEDEHLIGEHVSTSKPTTIPSSQTILKYGILWVLIPFLSSSLFVAWRESARQCTGVELREREFAPAKAFIKKKSLSFTGTAIFEEGGNVYREQVPSAKQYVGDGEEVEMNWHELLVDRYFHLSEEEAKAQFPSNYREFWHETSIGWTATYGLNTRTISDLPQLTGVRLDVFHTLHCVNHIRKALQRQNPPAVMNATMQTHQKYHDEHCIDVIRQAIQCSSDMTIIPARRFRGPVPHFIDSDQTHTCRDIWALREFIEHRKRIDDARKQKIIEQTGRPYDREEWSEGPFGFPSEIVHETE